MLDPTSKASFTTKLGLIQSEAQKLTEAEVTKKAIRQFRFENPRLQLTRRRVKRFQRVPFYAKGPKLCYLVDCAFLPLLTRASKKSFFCMVDCFCELFLYSIQVQLHFIFPLSSLLFAARYAFVRELPGPPSGVRVLDALRSIMSHSDVHPTTLVSDLVRMFLNYRRSENLS